MGSKKRTRRKGQETAAGLDDGKGGVPLSRTFAVLAVVLAVATCAAYWGVLGNDFTNYDDYDYVTKNPHVRQGITAESISWAFNIGYASNWHPLTWMSHMLDYQVYGLEPMGHHLTSLLLHVANVLLLFWVLCRMTGAPWRSAFVAALFGLHPLHVESVAWASERKDVLCTFFGLLAILAYVRYAERPELKRYLLVAAAFALGLMAKPMLVTLPVVLLLLDYWPLGRMQKSKNGGPGTGALLLEKAPLFAMSAASGVLTYMAQHRAGSVSDLELIPIGSRALNALLAYVQYLIMMVWPVGLAAHYPYLKIFPVWQVAGAILVLAGVSYAAWGLRKKYPYLLTGWAWYVITLLPVIGLVQVGSQAFADRYTYVPLIGIFIAITWGICDLMGLRRLRHILRPHGVAVAATFVCLVLAALTANQTRVWKDSFTLWGHTLSVSPNEWMAHYNLGCILEESGRSDEAIPYYRAATRIAPDLRDAHFNLANLLDQRGDFAGALRHYGEAARIDPSDAQAHNNLCCLLGKTRDFEQSIKHGRLAVKHKPDYLEAHRNLAISLALNKQFAEALEEARLCERYGGDLPRGFVDALEDELGRAKR
jgi:hypothetical protein